MTRAAKVRRAVGSALVLVLVLVLVEAYQLGIQIFAEGIDDRDGVVQNSCGLIGFTTGNKVPGEDPGRPQRGIRGVLARGLDPRRLQRGRDRTRRGSAHSGRAVEVGDCPSPRWPIRH